MTQSSPTRDAERRWGWRRKGFRALAAGALAAGALLPGRAPAAIVEEIAASVNDEIITRSDLESRERFSAQDLSARLTGAELQAALAEERSTLLRDMITEKLLIQQAERLYDMRKMRESILKNFKDVQKISSDEELDNLLREEGMTREELIRRLVEYNAPRSVVEYEVRDKIVVSDYEVDAWYAEHGRELGAPETVTFREIVFLNEGRGVDAAMELANKTVESLRAGADFVETAKSVSEAPSKGAGGLIGPFHRGELNQEIEPVVFSLPPGQVSDPVQAAYGAHILKVESRTDAQAPDLELARGKITDKLASERFQVELKAYVNNLWSLSTIEIRTAYLDRLSPDFKQYVKVREQDLDIK